jgi:hypothetical protein
MALGNDKQVFSSLPVPDGNPSDWAWPEDVSENLCKALGATANIIRHSPSPIRSIEFEPQVNSGCGHNIPVGPGHGGFAYVNWTFGIPQIVDISFDITFHQEPTGPAGVYIQLYDFRIGTTAQYFGFQHSLEQNKITTKFIWSRWGTRDKANAQVADDGETVSEKECGDDFIGLRFPYQWGQGNYTVHLAMRDVDAEGSWYELKIFNYKLSEWTVIGRMRFPFVAGQLPFINDGGGSWCEVFSGTKDSNDIAPFHLSYNGIYTCGRTVAARQAKTSYLDAVPNSDISLDDDQRRIHVRYGGDTTRITGPSVFDLK